MIHTVKPEIEYVFIGNRYKWKGIENLSHALVPKADALIRELRRLFILKRDLQAALETSNENH
jgi:hypothetical protein